MRNLLSILFFCCFVLSFAQEQKKADVFQTPSYVIEKEKGCVLVCNNYLESGINLYLHTDYKLSTSSREGIFLANNTALQMFIIDASLFNAQNDHDKIIQYIKYECDYVKESFGETLVYETETIKSKKRGDAVFWYFNMPKNANAEVTHQLFVNFIYKGYIFSISTPLFTGELFKDRKSFLLGVIENITFSEKKITWELLKKMIK